MDEVPPHEQEITLMTTPRSFDLKRARELSAELDSLANEMESKYATYGATKEEAFNYCNAADEVATNLDKLAEAQEAKKEEEDEEEAKAKEAKVWQRETDEPYMDSFNTSAPLQQDTDEPYMNLYDQAGFSDSQMVDSPVSNKVFKHNKAAADQLRDIAARLNGSV